MVRKWSWGLRPPSSQTIFLRLVRLAWVQIPQWSCAFALRIGVYCERSRPSSPRDVMGDISQSGSMVGIWIPQLPTSNERCCLWLSDQCCIRPLLQPSSWALSRDETRQWNFHECAWIAWNRIELRRRQWLRSCSCNCHRCIWNSNGLGSNSLSFCWASLVSFVRFDDFCSLFRLPFKGVHLRLVTEGNNRTPNHRCCQTIFLPKQVECPHNGLLVALFSFLLAMACMKLESQLWSRAWPLAFCYLCLAWPPCS